MKCQLWHCLLALRLATGEHFPDTFWPHGSAIPVMRTMTVVRFALKHFSKKRPRDAAIDHNGFPLEGVATTNQRNGGYDFDIPGFHFLFTYFSTHPWLKSSNPSTSALLPGARASPAGRFRPGLGARGARGAGAAARESPTSDARGRWRSSSASGGRAQGGGHWLGLGSWSTWESMVLLGILLGMMIYDMSTNWWEGSCLEDGMW